MSVTNPLIEINPNNVTPSLQQQPALGGQQQQQQQQTPKQAWQQVISTLPLSFIMAIIDGFHDFCKGGRVAGNVNTNDGESDVAADVSDAVKEAYYRQAEKLLGVYLSQTGTPTDKINEMISAMNDEKVGSVSNYERRVIKAMESRPELAPVLGSVRKDYSIQEIVNAPNSDGSDNEDGGKSGRPELWKEICGEVINPNLGENDKNAAIAAGPALYDKSLYLYWDQQYQLPQNYWRKGKHEPLEKDYQTYEPKFLKRLGNFIYTYLYPELSWSDEEEDKTAIVFDMASGCLGKIFGAFDKGSFRSSICPQTVSDSASTTENQIKSLNKKSFNRYNFCKTPNDISDDQNDIEAGLNDALIAAEGGNSPQYYKAQGNVLTWKYNTDNEIIHTRIIYAIGEADQYTQATFCSFNVYICTRKQPFTQDGQLEQINGLQTPWQLEKLVFSVAEKNGPSVAYLSSLVYALENAVGITTPDAQTNIKNTVPPKKKAMINITPLISRMRNNGFHEYFLQALLFDFKRCGDWEQSRSAQLQTKQVTTETDQYARVFFGTGDILCSFFSRCTKGNCLWHYEGKGGVVAWNIELYRNPNITKALDPQIENALEVVRKSTTIEKLLDRICHASEFYDRIFCIKELVDQHGHEAHYYYYGNKPVLNKNKIESKIEKLITMICRIGMRDVSYKCEVFLKLLNGANNILRKIVGIFAQGVDVCQITTNYYLMGLNYLRDIFTKMKVVNADSAKRFMMFVDAPNKNAQAYFTQDVNASIPPLQVQAPAQGQGLHEAGFVDFLNNRRASGNLSQAEFERLRNESHEETGIAAIILAKRIIFGPGYGGHDDDKFFEFLAICEWLAKVREQSAVAEAVGHAAEPDSIDKLVTAYADQITGNPEINFRKAIDLLKELKTTTKLQVMPQVGNPAQARSTMVAHAARKKPIYHILQVGEADPIFKLNDNTWVFNKAFGGSKSLGAFKFRTTDIKEFADYLKLMYYSGLKYRARIGYKTEEEEEDVTIWREVGPLTQDDGTILQDVYIPTDNWVEFTHMVKQTMPAFQQQGQQGQQPQLSIGWTQEQVSMDMNSFRNYVKRTVNSAWPTLSTKYADLLEDFVDFDCPAIYRIVIDGTIARSYVMSEDAIKQHYCTTVFCSNTGTPIVEGLDIRKIARSEYNLDKQGLTRDQKINIVAQEVGAFSRWLTILLDLDDSYQGVSPFSIDNLHNRADFLISLSTNINEKANDNSANGHDKAIKIINDVGSLEEFLGNSDNERFIELMTIAKNSIMFANKNLGVKLSGKCQGQGQGGGKKIVQKGGNVLTLHEQKMKQLTNLSYLLKDMSGEARALITPLTDEIQLKIVLNKMDEIGETIKQQAAAEAAEAAKAAEAAQQAGNVEEQEYAEKAEINAKEKGRYADNFLTRIRSSKAYKLLQQDDNFNKQGVQQRSEVVFIILHLYSIMLDFGDDYDFLGTYEVFDTIKYNFITSINSEMNPLTDENGLPYPGYSFRLLDAVLKIFIMINNLHIARGNENIHGDNQIRWAFESPEIELVKRDTNDDTGSEENTIMDGVQETKEGEEDVSNDMDDVLSDISSTFEKVEADADTRMEDIFSLTKKRKRVRDKSENAKPDGAAARIAVSARGEGDVGRHGKLQKGWTMEEGKARMLYRVQNNRELLEGLNNSIISINEEEVIRIYLENGGNKKVDINVILGPYEALIKQHKLRWESYKPLLNKLLSLILRSKLESFNSHPTNGNINRELGEILKFTIPYSQSMVHSPYFIFPHIKLLLAFSAIESFLPATTTERSQDPIFMLFFQNKNAIPANEGIDFTLSNWQNNSIINSIYLILYKLVLFEESSNADYKPIGAGTIVFIGGKKKKTRKRRKKKRKTRKAKKRKQNKKKKTRGRKKNKKKKKTRGRKKN